MEPSQFSGSQALGAAHNTLTARLNVIDWQERVGTFSSMVWHGMVSIAWCRYDLNVEWLDSREFKAGLEAYLKRTGVQAIILGTRK